MKSIKITYWISTSLMSLLMVFSAYSYLTQDKIAQAFHHLGFPDYFRVELAIAKLISAIVLLAPVPAKIKEWAYAGLGITFISAFIAHSASGDPVSVAIMPLIIMAILVVSYVSWGKKSLL
ncbi:DoxX family protein [Mucilaginibacter dorajii]|nr:DoxX family protein [Mucilaginibacter dorajii]MCS3736992.1 hypothetical protein [Mucilaginibacter dorajii]